MMRRELIAGPAMLLCLATACRKSFPAVPTWRPSFQRPIDRIIDRFYYCTDAKEDFTVFRYGTCVALESGMPDADAEAFSLRILSKIINSHPDMQPLHMDDGNIMISYNHPAYSIVLRDITQAHWSEIESRYMDGLTLYEVLLTPLGPNGFDDFGKQGLLGRAYMFMDAQAPDIIAIRRHTAEPDGAYAFHFPSEPRTRKIESPQPFASRQTDQNTPPILAALSPDGTLPSQARC
jgi:hypothetical protein